jgi:hypothetical protein
MLNMYRKGNCHGAISRKVLSDLHVGRLERVHILEITLKLRRQRVYIRALCVNFYLTHSAQDYTPAPRDYSRYN